MYPQSTIPHVCANCGRDFLALTKNVRRGHGHYCSRRCAGRGRWGDPLARFWAKIDQSGGPDACWPWLGARDKNGYGLGALASRTIRRVTHIVWELVYLEPLPADRWALHTCHYPPCCNPRHLYAGTAQQNADDRVGAGHTAVIQGERNRHAVLTADTVRLIRAMHGQGTHSLKSLARQFGVSDFAIWCIVKRRTWRHVE